VGAAAVSAATVAYPASMNAYLSLTDAPLRSTPLLVRESLVSIHGVA
jgi:hypothetical protein